MIELYTWRTPNGRTVSIMLEECGLAYEVHPVDISKRAQLDPEYRKISPGNKVPAIVDREGPDGRRLRVFESAAILQYLAEKTGRFRGNDPVTRIECTQWLLMAVSNLAPAAGTAFVLAHGSGEEAGGEPQGFGARYFGDQLRRMVGVLDFRLREYEYLAKTYTIADMAAYPWIAAHQMLGFDLDDYVGVQNWYNRLSKRPAIGRGMAVPG